MTHFFIIQTLVSASSLYWEPSYDMTRLSSWLLSSSAGSHSNVHTSWHPLPLASVTLRSTHFFDFCNLLWFLFLFSILKFSDRLSFNPWVNYLWFELLSFHGSIILIPHHFLEFWSMFPMGIQHGLITFLQELHINLLQPKSSISPLLFPLLVLIPTNRIAI